MKKFSFLLLLIPLIALIYTYHNYFMEELSPPPDYSALHPEGVVLYATGWCEYCKETRAFFDEHKIAYVEYDIEKSQEGRAQYDRLYGRVTPLVVIHGEVLHGYNPTKMKKLFHL